MKPVFQRSVDGETGDCQRACVASLLELPNHDRLPHITSEMWLFEWIKLLETFGMRWGSDQEAIWREGFWIGSVPSLNYPNKTHAIVMEGSCVSHDPSTKLRYETGRHLGSDTVRWGNWLEVSDVSKLDNLKVFRAELSLTAD